LCGTRICFGGRKISVSCDTSMISLSSLTKLLSCTTWQGDGETQVWSVNDIGMFVITRSCCWRVCDYWSSHW
jgi:hypothetical protein